MATEYVDLSSEAIQRLKRGVARNLVEAGASMVRDGIVEEMESSSPSGRRYPIPGTTAPRREGGQEIPGKWYTASAPGEPPAIREAIYRDSWGVTSAVERGNAVAAGVVNDRMVGPHYLWQILEFGGGRMAPRPHVRPAMERVKPRLAAMARRASS